MSERKSQKHEINMKATLSAIKERQERLSQIKEKKDLKKKQEEKMSTGVQLLYDVMKKQNRKLLSEIGSVFKTNLPFNCDLEKDYIKPPYLVPKIVSHKFERHLNSFN
jgi:hypothetical protein